MATVQSIEDIFSTVVIHEDVEPETIVCRGKKIVIKEAPYCIISKTFIPKEDMLPLKYGYALNEHLVHFTPHRIFKLNEVPYVSINKHNEADERDIMFVFNIEDLRKKEFLKFYMLFYKKLPTEIVDYIITNFLEKNFIPFKFESEYKGAFPKSISKSQLKMLYERGFVKMGINQRFTGSINILSDEAFDHVYPNGPNRLQQIFRTKEDMNAFVQQKLDQLSF
jgi:hypothetical protein